MEPLYCPWHIYEVSGEIIPSLNQFIGERSLCVYINIIFGAIKNDNLTDEVIVTVIATGFDDVDQPLTSIGVENLVSKAWDKKVNSIPTSTESNSSSSDLDIPSPISNDINCCSVPTK